ncbi:MAG: hypothetical protein GTO53_09800 [Planctomycetales bacterium]|nr:hypothetical protein [Planctomycetales bacterium]NIM09415.1 hypothetical protein [Planctomycetales bacterium]NIN08893.1 hypothetical protein [Planctomycetales bacterium]NIN78008.1 hypothetical protein [Planctomycetales bacterium]NIO35196.1 hypothetical protein [Planctomycetales bacterium]
MPVSVAELCEQKEISVDQLVDRCGLEPDRVRAILLGRWTPSPDERRKIAAVFDLVPDDISWGHKTPIQHLYGHGPG